MKTRDVWKMKREKKAEEDYEHMQQLERERQKMEEQAKQFEELSKKKKLKRMHCIDNKLKNNLLQLKLKN